MTLGHIRLTPFDQRQASKNPTASRIAQHLRLHIEKVISPFECVGASYGSTVEKGRSEAYPISILEQQHLPMFGGTRYPQASNCLQHQSLRWRNHERSKH